MQAQNAQTASQRIGEFGDQQHVGRAGQDKTSWSPLAIDGNLQRREQRRNALHLIQDDARGQLRHETDRVPFRGRARRRVVEREIAIPAGLAH